jgi:hypothetical protein
MLLGKPRRLNWNICSRALCASLSVLPYSSCRARRHDNMERSRLSNVFISRMRHCRGGLLASVACLLSLATSQRQPCPPPCSTRTACSACPGSDDYCDGAGRCSPSPAPAGSACVNCPSNSGCGTCSTDFCGPQNKCATRPPPPHRRRGDNVRENTGRILKEVHVKNWRRRSPLGATPTCKVPSHPSMGTLNTLNTSSTAAFLFSEMTLDDHPVAAQMGSLGISFALNVKLCVGDNVHITLPAAHNGSGWLGGSWDDHSTCGVQDSYFRWSAYHFHTINPEYGQNFYYNHVPKENKLPAGRWHRNEELGTAPNWGCRPHFNCSAQKFSCGDRNNVDAQYKFNFAAPVIHP